MRPCKRPHFLCLFCVFFVPFLCLFVPLLEYKNKKRVTAVTQYLVNLKSNTMKNTHANVERICEPHKLFLKKMLFLKAI